MTFLHRLQAYLRQTTHRDPVSVELHDIECVGEGLKVCALERKRKEPEARDFDSCDL